MSSSTKNTDLLHMLKSSQIQIVVGELAQETVDAIVSTTGTDANLRSGTISYSILEAGGESIQEELSANCPTVLSEGGIYETSGGELECQKIYHTVLRRWTHVNDRAEKLLKLVLTNCLERASKEKFKSIAFPALGSGLYYRFPGNRSADIMFQAIEAFLQKNWLSSLKTVKIVIHPSEDLLQKDFEARRDGIQVIHENFLSKEVVLKKPHGSYPGLTVRVIIGCLSQLQADVLVNTTQSNLELTVGAVSRSLIEAGGKIIEQECRTQFPLGLPADTIAQTQGGKLNCKKVFHIVLPAWKKGIGGSEKALQSIVIKCLEEMSKQRFESIAFPILGTGYLEYPPEKSAVLLLTAIMQYMKDETARSVHTISVVVHHKDRDIRMAVEAQVGKSEEIANTVTTIETAGGSKMTAGPHTHVIAGQVVQQNKIFEHVALVSGEKEALEGTQVKYFILEPSNLMSMTPEDYHFRTVESQFFRFIMKDLKFNRHIFQVTKVEYVVNPKLIKRFRLAQDRMLKKQKGYEVPVLAFHGTAKKNVHNICEEGFRQPDHPHFEKSTDVGWYGNGIYFSEYPRFAMNYMQKSQMLLLCRVLQGKVFKCEKLNLGASKEPGYDSHVDPFGKEIVIYYDDCILPCYVVYFDICKRFKFKTDKYDPNENDETVIEYLSEMNMHKGEEKPKK